jgi:hypothetical protein
VLIVSGFARTDAADTIIAAMGAATNFILRVFEVGMYDSGAKEEWPASRDTCVILHFIEIALREIPPIKLSLWRTLVKNSPYLAPKRLWKDYLWIPGRQRYILDM